MRQEYRPKRRAKITKLFFKDYLNHLDAMIVIGYSMDSATQQIDSDCDKEVRR